MSNKNAMLVKLSISQWYNKATDKAVAKEIAEKYGAESTVTDQYVKTLLPSGSMTQLQHTIGKLRTAHYKLTMPWQDGGLRILASKAYFEYTAQMRTLKDEFETNVENFVKGYRSAKEQAKASKKGLYNEADYPSESELRNYFEVNTSFYPLPDSGDFRLDIEESVANDIRAHAEQEFAKARGGATKFLFERLEKLLTVFYNATDKPKKKFHESTVNNLYEFAELLPDLNIGHDEDLNRFAQNIHEYLCPYSVDALRSDESARAQAAQYAKRILDELTSKKEGEQGV